MGTSASSKGPLGGVPMVPPWVLDPSAVAPTDSDIPPPATNPDEEGNPATTQTDTNAPQAIPAVPMAPAARFRGARLNLGSFARGGSSDDMRRGLGHYVRSGYGGARIATTRFGGTTSTAGALYGALSNLARGEAAGPRNQLDPAKLRSRSAREVIDAVVETLRPVDGTQDTEAGRESIKDALSELLTAFPEADLLNLSEIQRLLAVERYIAHDIYRRFALDVGKTVQEKAPSAVAAVGRLKEVKNYIKQTVAAAFRKLNATAQLTGTKITSIVTAVLQETFQVFEGYAS